MNFSTSDLDKNSVSIDDYFTMYFGSVDSFLLESPVRSDRIYLGFCLDGSAEVEVDLINHTIIKNEIILIPPNHILFHHKISENFRFVLLSFSNKFFHALSNDLRKYPLYFLLKQKFPSLKLDETEMSQIMEFYNLMWKYGEDKQNKYRSDLVKHLLSLVFINIYYCATKRNLEKPPASSRREEIIGTFFSLIFEHFKEAKDVSFYADKLCVSPKYLSTVMKEVVGKTTKECIDHFVIIECKFLLNSNLTIQEVSQQLNFPNQSFFGKYFKKHTGMSPLNYRHTK